MPILPKFIRRRIIFQVLLATLPVLFCGLWIVVQLLQGSFHSIIDINNKLQSFFQQDIISLENEVVRLTDRSYANAAKLEQYKQDHENYKQQDILYKRGFSAKGAIVGGAVPLSPKIIGQLVRNDLSPKTVLTLLRNIYKGLAYKVWYWDLTGNLSKLARQEGFSNDFIGYVQDAANSGKSDWFEDDLDNLDIVVSLVPYKKNVDVTGIFIIIFDISKAYSTIETADRLTLSIKSAKLQEQRLLEGKKVTKHFRKRRREQNQLVVNNAWKNQAIITGARNKLIMFIGANMTVLISIALILFWWLGTRRITELRNWMVALAEGNYMLETPATGEFSKNALVASPSDQKLRDTLSGASDIIESPQQKNNKQDSPERIAISFNDEIGELSKGINFMLDSLDSTKVSKNLLVKENEERKRIEKELRLNQQRLKTIFDSVQAGVIIIDAKTRVIVDANPAAQTMIGAHRRQLIGEHCYESVCPQRLQECRMCQSDESIDNMEHLLFTAKGQELPVIKTETAIMLDGRRHFICSFVDISVLQRARLDLEEAKRNAEQANKIKSQFLANMSHEIRTPLNGVLGMASIALETELTEEQNHIIRTINNEADSLLRIINDILDFSKIEAGKIEIEAIAFDLYSLCEEVVQTTIFAGEQKGLEIIFFISPDLPDQVIGDPGRIRQVLTNLCGNALKFTHTGEIYIKVESDKKYPSTNRIRFSIKDSGIGIPEKKLADVFESFSQADGSTTRLYGGTGLGTTISKQLVELMGGEIGVSSEEGAGSTFWFVLPIAEASDRKDIVPVNDRILSGKRVLIVDDSPTILFILEEYLNSWGCIPIKATNGQEGLGIVHKMANSVAAIDLILTDFDMPIMNGFDFVSRLRGGETAESHTPVIVLRSSSSRKDDTNWDHLAIQGYMNKPILRQELKMTVCSALGASGIVKTGKSLNKRMKPTASPNNDAAKLGKILLVEDYPTNRKVASHYLSSAGYAIDEAEDGELAVRLIKNQKYDLVFMDIQMPVMDGYEATAKIREWEQETSRETRIPIIAMTAHALAGYRKQCIKIGMDDYISKPLKRNDFIDMAKKWFPSTLTDNIGASKSTPLTAEQSASPVDISNLLTEMQDDTEIVVELFESFSNSLEQQKVTTRQAFDTQNNQQLEKEVHAIKGAALNVFAGDLARVAKELEEESKAEDTQISQDLFLRFEKSVDEAQAYMQNFVRTQA